MNNKKVMSILKKVYHHENSDYERNYIGEVGKKVDFLTQEQNMFLEQANLVPNNFQELTHDALIEGFLKIKKEGVLSLDFCTTLFIKSLSGDYPRYRQTLMSFWYLNDISKHKYKKSELSTICAVCKLRKNVVIDRTCSLYTYYLGHSWNEMPENFLAELQEISKVEKPTLIDGDKERFISLLQEIDKTELTETPGQLEKRIAKLKLLPKTDKFKRYGILQTLAVIGVMPSNLDFDNQPSRSDIVLPLSGWNGELGVDFDKVNEIFNLRVSKK